MLFYRFHSLNSSWKLLSLLINFYLLYCSIIQLMIYIKHFKNNFSLQHYMMINYYFLIYIRINYNNFYFLYILSYLCFLYHLLKFYILDRFSNFMFHFNMGLFCYLNFSYKSLYYCIKGFFNIPFKVFNYSYPKVIFSLGYSINHFIYMCLILMSNY